jgi:sulfatase modifying factor 1
MGFFCWNEDLEFGGGKMRNILAIIISVVAVGNIASADNIHGIDIEFVNIGNAGNAADTGGNVGSGSVGYQYQIGKYEVTNSQWNAFTAIAGAPSGNPATAYDQSSQYPGAQQPASNVSWYEAAQFCNYLTSGDKSKGAYLFSGNNNNAGYLLGINRDAAKTLYGTIYVLPTEAEWYKAAYFKPDGSGYSLYANGTNVAPSTSEAAYSQLPLLAPWDAGDGTMEQNGTFDMMGNVWEWNETFIYSRDDGILGGSSYNSVDTIKSTYRNSGDLHPYDEFYDAGFRVAIIPEPTTLSLLALGAFLAGRKRRK